MGRLDGKVALISGAARGIGAATARKFCEEGAKVLLTDKLELVNETAAILHQAGYDAKAMLLDVRNEQQWAAGVKRAEEEFGGLDILVNNAGIFEHGFVDETTMEEYRETFEVNLFGPLMGIRAALPAIRRRGGGAIVTISSLATRKTQPNSNAYSASKAAVARMSQGTALQCAGENIRINTIHPGPVDTQMMAHVNMPDIIAAIPNGRMAQPLDIANMAAFLASDEAAYITGAEFVVDGGLQQI